MAPELCIIILNAVEDQIVIISHVQDLTDIHDNSNNNPINETKLTN